MVVGGGENIEAMASLLLGRYCFQVEKTQGRGPRNEPKQMLTVCAVQCRRRQVSSGFV